MENKLKEMRYKRMMSISELSRRSGVCRASIWKIETKRAKNVTIKTMQALADALDMPVTDIFFAEDG